mgnify:FL=1
MGFLEKNKDFLHEDLLQLLASCKTSLPQSIAAKIAPRLQKMMNGGRKIGTELQKQSIAVKFKVYHSPLSKQDFDN